MSLFKRPAWATSTTKSDGSHSDSDDDIFGHRDNFVDIVAERKRREQEREDKRKAKHERRIERSLSKEQTAKEGVAQSPGTSGRKRRINAQESEQLLRMAGMGSRPAKRRSSGQGSDESDEEIRFDAPALRSLSPREVKTRASRRARGEEPIVMDLEAESDDDVQIQFVQPASRSDPTLVSEDEEDDDPMFAALAKRAREQRETQKQKEEKSAMPDVGSGINSTGGLTESPRGDAVIALLVTSQIPGAKAIQIQRKLSQRLQEVREGWCSKQIFPQGIAKSDVYLTFRLRRLYDSTLVRNLGLDVDAEGVVTLNGAEGKEDAHQIHLEVVTDDILTKLKAQEAREEGGLLRDPETAEVSRSGPAQEELLVRILLKAKGHSQPFKLKVRPSTPVSRIMNACRKPFNITDAQSVYLEFDGERLNEDSVVQDTEIEDQDVVDVHIL